MFRTGNWLDETELAKGKVASLRLKPVEPKKLFEGSDSDRVSKAKHFAFVQLLESEVSGTDAVTLEGRHDQAGSDGVLHIFAAEEHKDAGTSEHAKQAFASTIRMFSGLDVRIKDAVKPAPFDPARDALPEGLNPLETDDLVERRNRTCEFGRAIRTYMKEPAHPPTDAKTLRKLIEPFVIRTGSAVGSKVGSCTQTIAVEG